MSQIVGVVGGSIGHAPFDPGTWSGSSLHLFSAMREQSILHRAFGADIPKMRRYWLLARNFSSNRSAWRKRFYFDLKYRRSLTRAVAAQIRKDDSAHAFLQVGAMFSLPSVLRGSSRTASYHDGNLLESVASGFGLQGVPSKTIDKTIEYERELAHSTDVILTMSEYLRRSFIEGFGIPEHRVVNVGGGINYECIPAMPAQRNYDSGEVLFVGVEFERKGGKQLLTAFERVVQQIPRAKLHIVGPASVSVPQSLQKNVIVHGFLRKSDPTDAERMARLYESCSILVLPSLYEPFGIAPLEAMVRGMACIVTDAWALREMVRPGVNGELVQRDSVDDLASKIAGLLSAPDDIRRFGEAGRQIVIERYTWPAVARRIHAAIHPVQS